MSLPDPLIGRVIDGYRVERLLGRGGMASVYRAVDEGLARFVALKIIDPHSNTEAEYRERFRNEARAIAQLKHPNIVGIYRFGEVDQLYYMAMDFIDGSDLRWILESYSKNGELMPHESVYRIISQVAKALDYAHKQGVIHRDVKPSNIMLNAENEAILTDFGLALVTDEGTKGTTFGSPHYIAPEQAIASSGAVRQSDLYSLGVTMYEMLTGRVPFAEGSALQIAMSHMTEPPPDPREFNPSLHPAFLPILKMALEKEPENRYQTGAKMTAALRAAVNEAKKTPLDTQTQPVVQPQKSANTFIPPLQLSRMEVPEKLAEYRAEHPITTVTGVNQKKQSPVPPIRVKRRPSRLTRFYRLVSLLLLVAFITVSAAYIALNLQLLDTGDQSTGETTGSQPNVALAPLVIEGVVRAQEGAVITVYDVEVTLPSDTPLLQTVQIGDVVRLEGLGGMDETGGFTLIQVNSANRLTTSAP
jgi:eukaryotic-like serine/threonine-protein kinase